MDFHDVFTQDESAKAEAPSDHKSKDDTSSIDTLTPLASPQQTDVLASPMTVSAAIDMISDSVTVSGPPVSSPKPDTAVIEVISSRQLKTNSLEKDKIYIRRECSDGEIKIKSMIRPRTNSGSRYMTDMVGLSTKQIDRIMIIGEF